MVQFKKITQLSLETSDGFCVLSSVVKRIACVELLRIKHFRSEDFAEIEAAITNFGNGRKRGFATELILVNLLKKTRHIEFAKADLKSIDEFLGLWRRFSDSFPNILSLSIRNKNFQTLDLPIRITATLQKIGLNFNTPQSFTFDWPKTNAIRELMLSWENIQVLDNESVLRELELLESLTIEGSDLKFAEKGGSPNLLKHLATLGSLSKLKIVQSNQDKFVVDVVTSELPFKELIIVQKVAVLAHFQGLFQALSANKKLESLSIVVPQFADVQQIGNWQAVPKQSTLRKLSISFTKTARASQVVLRGIREVFEGLKRLEIIEDSSNTLGLDRLVQELTPFKCPVAFEIQVFAKQDKADL